MAQVVLTGTIRIADYVSVRAAGEQLGIDEKTVRGYLYSEKFTTYKWYDLTLVSVKELNKEIERRKTGDQIFY